MGGSLALRGLEVRRFALALIALALVLATVFWYRPNVASYNGLRLLLNLSPVLVFTALAQMFVMTASDIDLGIGSFVALVNAIVAGILSDHTVLAVAMLLGCARPVHILTPTATVRRVINMTALAVVDAQEQEKASVSRSS